MIFNLVKRVMLATGVSVLTLFSGMSLAALDNKGTEFILAFLPNAQSNEITELHLTSDVVTDVTIEYPVNSPTFSTTETVTPGNITIVSIPNTAATAWTANTVANNAVRASAADEFVAYVVNRAPVSSDAALGLPVDVMNTEYLVADYATSFAQFFNEFIVYAAFDATTVTINPTADLVGHPAGVPFDVTLNRGEGVLLRSSSGAAGTTLTGTRVSADRPVGMVNGHEATQVPTGTAAADHIFEIAQPVQTWGDQILVANLPQRPGGTIYRILASQDTTAVSQDGAPLGIINMGDFIETPPLAGSHLFSGDKPIYVVQYMTGVTAPGAISGDPAMGNMIPFAQYQSDYTFSTVGDQQFSQNFLTVIAENADVSTITLDGAPIGAGSFSPIGSTGFSSAIIQLTDGTHTTSSNGVHGITVEGYNSADSYIYPGGALFEFINPPETNAPVCVATTFPGPPPSATGSVTDNAPDDSGVFFVNLLPGANNVALTVDPFTPGDGIATFSLDLIDANLSGQGTVEGTDGAGNVCTVAIDLSQGTTVERCDVDNDGTVDVSDINAIMARRNLPASGPDDPADADGNGVIDANDARQCVLQCTNAECAPSASPAPPTTVPGPGC